jgi:hypothetical protein
MDSVLDEMSNAYPVPLPLTNFMEENLPTEGDHGPRRI